MGKNYLILKKSQEDQQTESSYMMRMAERNQIPGLLPLRCRSVNGQTQYWYDITSRQPFPLLAAQQNLRFESLVKLLSGLRDAACAMEEYLMDAEGLCLQPELIYMDPDSWQCFFCFFPYSGRKGLTELAEYILKHLDHTDRPCVQLGYGFYAMVREESRSLREMLDSLLEEKADREPEKPSSGDEAERMEASFGNAGAGAPADEPLENLSPTGSAQDLFTPDRWEAINGGSADFSGSTEAGSAEKGGSLKDKVLWIVLALLFLGLYAAAVHFFALELSQAGGLAGAVIAGYAFFFHLLHNQQKTKKTRNTGEDAEFLAALRNEAYEPWHVREEHVREDQEEGRASDLRLHSRREIGSQSGRESKPGQAGPDRPASGENAVKEEGEGVTECMLLSDAIKSVEANAPHKKQTAVLRSLKPGTARDIRLTDGSLLIGKKKSRTDVCISHHTISRIHARVEKKDGGYFITDLNSTNGTFVNGEQLSPNETRPLNGGDQVQLADLKYVLVVPQVGIGE